MNRQALLVLGMHRSGTSALTKTLQCLGVDLGSSLYQGSDNPRGYFEHEALMKTNDELVSTLLGITVEQGQAPTDNWMNPEPFAERWWSKPEVEPFRTAIRECIEQDFGSAALWGFKDPRLCVVLPLYLQILDELGCEPLFVHCFRNPTDVALSLERRSGYPAEQGLLLWLRYVLDAFYYSFPYRCAFTCYEQLMSDWKSALQSCAEQLRLSWPKALEAAAPEIAAFLTPSLRRFDSDSAALEGSGELFELISGTHAFAQRLGRAEIDKAGAKQLFTLRKCLDRASVQL